MRAVPEGGPVVPDWERQNWLNEEGARRLRVMGAFLGCCVIAAVIYYVGRKLGRVLWSLLAVVENDADRRAARDGMDAHNIPRPLDVKQPGRKATGSRW